MLPYLLQILSGEDLVIFDPLFSFSDDGGTRFKLSPETINPIQDHICAFDQFLPNGWNREAFNGTVVRLPLRTEPGDLREKIVHPTEIEQLFRDFIKSEINISMLFLQHLRSIELVVVHENGRKHQLGKCTIEVADILPNGNCTKVVRVETSQASPQVEKWLVMHQHFAQEEALHRLSSLAGSLSERVLKKHKLRPDVGLAFPLDPTPTPDSGIGQLFTFLRLPLPTGFPAHVHAFFSLTPSRQNLRNAIDSGVVKGSDDDILIKWNKILFENFIPRAWACLLETLAGLGVPIDILSAWPAAQSFTKCGESVYWASFPENVLKYVIETGAAVWPALGQNNYKDLHNVFFVCSKINDGTSEALARQGLSICRPPAHIFKMVSDSNWSHQCILTPEHASAALKRHWDATSLPSIGDQDRNAIIQYLLSSGNIKNIVNLPIIPTVSGRFVALCERNSSATIHTLLARPDFELFNACDGDAIFLDHLPPSVVPLFERSGPVNVNLKLLDNQQVLEYLDCHPTRQGVDLATFRVDGAASQFLSRFWIWVEGWRRRSELVPVLESRYLLPESYGMRLAIRTQPLFKAVETQPVLATSLFKLGIPFLSTSLQVGAQEKLEIFGFLKTVSDIRDILKCLARCHIAGAVPLTDEEATFLLKHFNRCMVNVPIKDFLEPEREAFKIVPIFPVVQFKDNDRGFEKRFTSVDGLTVYGVRSFELLPCLDNVVFIDVKNHPLALDPVLLPILSERPSLSDLDILELCATSLPQHSKEHLVCILKHAAGCQQLVSPKLQNILRSQPYAYASNGSREAPQALIDQRSPIHFLYTREPSRLPRLEDNYDRQIVEALSVLGLLDQSLSASNVMDRIRCIALNSDIESCLTFLQVLEDHSFNYKSLCGHGFNKSIAWLPTQKGSLANAIDCRPTRLPSAEPKLFDQVLDLVDDRARIPATLQQILGWHERIPLKVLFEQFERALELPKIAAFSRAKSLLKELSQRDLSGRRIKQLQDILQEKAWVPTTAGKLVESWRAVLVPSFPGVFTVDSELKNSEEGKRFLTTLGCLGEPSFETIQQRLTQLSKESPGPARTRSATDALKFACSRPIILSSDERSQLLVPDKFHELRPVENVVFDDLGPEKSIFISQGLHIANSAVDDSLAVYLGLERLGLKHSNLHSLGEDMGVKTVTIVQKTLEQYTEKQFLPEFLANAQDAGASKFSIIVNEFASTEGNFLYPTFRDGLHKGPSVMVYNDSEFSKQDFDGICRTYLGGKTNNPDSIGQFGLGALTMFHITECAAIYSGDEVLFLDPSKKYLPIVKQAAVRLPLKVIHDLLEGIAQELNNSRWWPGSRMRAAQTQEDENTQQITTVHEDSLTATLTKAFYSAHLVSSARRVFCSMYRDQAFDFSTAVLFSHLVPNAVREVCDILQPPALIKLSTGAVSRLRTEKVEFKALGPTFLKELLLADGGAEIIREILTHEALEELLIFLSEGEGDNLQGLPLLRLQDETWTKFEFEDASRRYSSPFILDYVKNGLFPADQFVHSQFFPSRSTPEGSLLLKTLLKSNVNVVNLDSGAVERLTKERLATMVPEEKNAWIMSFWRMHPFFPTEGLSKSIENLPLVPTWNGAAYKSFVQCKSNGALLIDPLKEEWLKSCLQDLGIDVIALDTRFPSTLRLLLDSPEYASTGTLFHRFLRCLSPIVDGAVGILKTWTVQRQSAFAEWVRSEVSNNDPMEKGDIQVARKLPVWRARKGMEETLCPATHVQLLPYRIPLEVGCFSTTFRTSDNAVQYLGVKRTTVGDLHQRLRLPDVLGVGEEEDTYRVLVRNYLNSDYIEHIVMPNADRNMVDCEDLCERTTFFQAAFGESSPRFLLPSFNVFARDLYSKGLRREENLDLPLFRQCAQAFQRDPSPAPEKLERAQIVYRVYCETLPLHVPSDHGAGWHDLDDIRFIPRNLSSVRRRGLSSEIELPLHIRQLPSFVAPREVVQEKFLAIAWTQRVALRAEPTQRLLVAFPDFGCPTGQEVIAHLRALCQLPRGTIVLHDLKATYQWLTENSPAIASFANQLKDEPIFLNVDNPDVHEWRWASASQMAFETEDLTSIQGVRQFLLPFRAFLKSVGVLEAYYPEIEAESEHSGALYDQKQFQSLREKLNAQRLEGKFTDVLFVPQKEAKGRTREGLYKLDHPSLRGHRNYLASCVPWFEDLFLGGFREGSGGSAGGVMGSVEDSDSDLDDGEEDVPEGEESVESSGAAATEDLTNMLIVPLSKSRKTIEAVLNYLYTGQPFAREEGGLEDLLQTLELSHFLDIRGLFDLSQREMVRRRLVNPETLEEVRERTKDLDAKVIKKWCEDYEKANPELIRVFSQETGAR
ncbi:hypothetical protein EST38_g3552 [Candolleomyces aberdarensis]|uniref:BTB domain-containing protein n=1 Tax=Candolleomyces aberdarensis TaxID=2316362 RepID=A0A4Q2DT90_9AGAR|nr:hypothetical protein EST38_g3552 [Candolleomyces aberdarensis]